MLVHSISRAALGDYRQMLKDLEDDEREKHEGAFSSGGIETALGKITWEMRGLREARNVALTSLDRQASEYGWTADQWYAAAIATSLFQPDDLAEEYEERQLCENIVYDAWYDLSNRVLRGEDPGPAGLLPRRG